jgi:glutamate formiminotransferase/formiminotetrahydrofolate cyclodeaminase
MSAVRLVECVPNFSEGRDAGVIQAITDRIAEVEGVRLLDVDPGRATNRTVVTFVGPPDAAVQAAFLAIREASRLIDMRKHSGEHPRMGATDVCPFVPISGMSMEEAVACARQLGRRVGEELGIPVYLYEYAATCPERRNLATIREGEYEGLEQKLARPEWAPDFGPAAFHAGAGATVVGARDFLVAYNVNLNTTSVRRANSVAFDIRERGRPLRRGDPLTGPIVRDESGETVWQPGALKHVKAIGWFIKEYGIAQVSCNLTNIRETPVHVVFDEACRSAEGRGMRVTGSELVGMIPLQAMLDAGRHYLAKQGRSLGVSEPELIRIAVRSLGLDDLAPFEAGRKIIEYRLREGAPGRLVDASLVAFADDTASESPAPGGGSVSAYVGALGAALGTMVANLSSHKRGWDDRWEAFSDWAVEGQARKDTLLALVDADTRAFEAVMAAHRMPGGTAEERSNREAAVQAAVAGAIEAPLTVMREAVACMPLLMAMAESGMPESVSDAGVGALCARAAVRGAHLNVRINLPGLGDEDRVRAAAAEAAELARQAEAGEAAILSRVDAVLAADPA